MGQGSSKESRSAQQRSGEQSNVSPSTPSAQQSPADRFAAHIYASRGSGGRSARHDLPFLTSFARDRENEQPPPERPRETRQEREARRAERERQARLRERERSMREEHVDGGYLVTLGTYTGPEDFSKAIVRQLQLERRLAPFWRGLNDHSGSWTEAQLVAAGRGERIPAPDEVPMDRSVSQQSNPPRPPSANGGLLGIPITGRSPSFQGESGLSSSQPASASHSSLASPTSPSGPNSSSALFRGRAKTLASLATGSKGQSPDMTPQEIRLPHDPNVNGLPIEAYLYREASECPICFMYYPPWLNKTRCCDQPICSECFVQIKRPDPHPPEHEQPGEQRSPEAEAELLVSEVAACPFCVTPEFGVTYEPPPFRRGLAYAHHGSASPLTALKNSSSAMSSSSSLNASGNRRRATSLSASASQVITTDKVRPDWAKKLADARAHVLRRSAAATALHNAAYVLGNQDVQARSGFGRRRRTAFADTLGGSESGTPAPEGEEESRDLYPGRGSSRRNRVDDLEELMMMEAIRLSLAAEEERKKKEDKDQKKKDKKEAKEIKKEAKAAEKVAKKNSSSVATLNPARSNESSSTWASTSMARSSSNLGAQASASDAHLHGKGKAPAQDFAGFNPLTEPTSTLNAEVQGQASGELSASTSGQSPVDNPQRHLEASRANIQNSSATGASFLHARQLSSASSITSSMGDSTPGSFQGDSGLPSASASGMDLSTPAQEGNGSRSATPGATPGQEPMFNFRSLAAMIGDEDGKPKADEHLEHAEQSSRAEDDVKEPSPTGSPRVGSIASTEISRARGEGHDESVPAINGEADDITPANANATTSLSKDDKKPESVHILDQTQASHTAQ